MGYVPKTPPETGCYISGLFAHNALWDTNKSTIKAFDIEDIPAVNPLPILHVVPALKGSAKGSTSVEFKCPLFCSQQGWTAGVKGHVMDLLIQVESEKEALDLIERRVFISSILNENYICHKSQ